METPLARPAVTPETKAEAAGLGARSLTDTLLLGLAVLAAYFGLWNAYFTQDDFWMLGWVRHRSGLLDAMLAQLGYGVRFLLDANLWLRVQVLGLEPAGYYWISLLQHFGIVLLVYGLARAWTGRRWVALLAGLLFATTPTHFEVVTWITGSNYSLAALPYLGALFGLTLYRAGRSVAWYWLSVALCLAALLVAEVALSLPLTLLVYDGLMGRGRRPWREWRWTDLVAHAPYWLLLGGYLGLQVLNLHAGSSEAAVAREAFRPGLHILTNLVNLAYLPLPPYALSALLPWLGA
ncbi:MAG: hypothetical protein JNK29_19090, partial [Anaerolineales bacterium]|nr:hypothetical protein [Anaerolineales bacterium]